MPYKISPSSMSRFKETGSCKKNWFFKNVEKTIERDPPSEQMIKGQVFETLAIGSNVTGTEMPNHQFLYLKDGSKSTSLKRIEEQANKVKNLLDPRSDSYIGFFQTNVQVHLENDKMKGVLDMICQDDFEGKIISDLKFTGDVDATFGNYAWGRNPDDIDWSQIAIYKRLFRDNFEDSKAPKTNIMVFDDSPKMGSKLFDIKLSDNYIDNVVEEAVSIVDYVDRVRSGDIDIDLRVTPSKSNCDKCPLECEFRFKESKLEKITVYV